MVNQIFLQKIFLILGKSPPKDYQIDLYCFHKAKKERILIYRFDVEFKKRFSGNSKWNTGIIDKINFIIRTIMYSFKLRFLVMLIIKHRINTVKDLMNLPKSLVPKLILDHLIMS